MIDWADGHRDTWGRSRVSIAPGLGRRRRFEAVIEGARIPIMGSDAQIRGGVVGSCGLCERRPVGLRLSHVVPSWAATWMRRERVPGGPGLVGNYRTLGVKTATQDLIKQYLLCADCEQYLGVAEKYWAALARGSRRELDRIGVSVAPIGDVAVLTGVDRASLLRAIAGTWLRMALSDAYLYSRIGVPVGRNGVDELRAAVLNDDFPPNRVSLLAMRWMNYRVEGANPRSLVQAHTQLGDGGRVMLRLCVAGFDWCLIWGEKGGVEPLTEVAGPQSVLQQGADWSIAIGEWLMNQAVFSFQDFQRQEQRVADFPYRTDLACPCGLGEASFGECCNGRWVAATEPSL